MPEDRVERALDVLVYGPLGFGLWLRDLAPSMIDTVVARGRAEVDRRHDEAQQRITTARSMGEVAVAFGVPRLRKRAEQQLQQVRSQADRVVETVVGRAGGNGSGAVASTPPPRHAPVPGDERVPRDEVAPPGAVASANTSAGRPPADAVGAAGATPRSSSSGHLAIPGYDALSASQVVERLAGLGPDELRAVREYETSNRNRRTILGKIDQLTSA